MVAGPKRIIVGVDGSPASLTALEWSVALASRTNGASLQIVHSWTPAMAASTMAMPEHELDSEARAVLDQVLEAVPIGDVDHTTEVARDVSPAAALVDRSGDADLLVTGTRGLNRFERLLLGSVAFQCAQHAPCPFVAIPADSSVQPGPITVGYDDSEASREALRWALSWIDAGFPGARVVTVAEQQSWLSRMTPASSEPDPEAQRHTLTAQLVELVGADAAARLDTAVVETDDGVADALVREAKGGILAVGSRGLGGFKGLLLGSVSQRCLETSAQPVAVLRTG